MADLIISKARTKDAVKECNVSGDFYEALAEYRSTPEAKLVYDLLAANLDFVDSGGFQFWDSLTAAIFSMISVLIFQGRIRT